MRIKRSVSALKKRRAILKQAKGYWGTRSKLYRVAKNAVMKAGNYAYIGRKHRKRNFRTLWIVRISAACKLNDLSYSKFMFGLKNANISLNRKMLAEMAVKDEKAFAELAKTAKANLNK